MALVPLAIMVLAACGLRWGPFEAVDDALWYVNDAFYDTCLASVPVRAPTGRVVVVAIDDASENSERLGPFPWPRSVHARLLRRLTEAGVGAVLFDVAFMARRDPEDDQALRDALRACGRVALVMKYTDREGSRFPVFCEEARAVGFNSPMPPDAPARFLHVYNEPLASLRIGDLVPQALVVQGLLLMQGADPNTVVGHAPGLDTLVVGEYRIPVTQKVEMRVPYRVRSLPQISYVDALEEPLPDLRGKCVVVAATQVEEDVFPVPCTAEGKGGRLAGGLILAQAMDAVLGGATIYEASAPVTWAVVLAMELLALVLALRMRRVACDVLVAVTLPALLLGASWVLLARCGVWASTAAPVAVAWLLHRFLRAWLGQERVLQSFRRLVPGLAVGEIERTGGLVAREIDATIMFQDIQGYTTFSEQLSPGQVLDTLNAFFSRQQEIVARHGGHVIDMQGDAQMVLFGGDGKGTNHARAAVDAAWEMLLARQELDSAVRDATHLDALRFGVGLATGKVALGEVGGALRGQISALGDTTNVAARLQALTREVGCPLLATEATFDQVRDRYRGEAVPGVKLKGKQTAVIVFKIVERQERGGNP